MTAFPSSSTVARWTRYASPGWSRIGGGPTARCAGATGRSSRRADAMRSCSTTWKAAGGGGSAEYETAKRTTRWPRPVYTSASLNSSDAVSASTPTPSDPGPTAVGTWSGGRFMGFGEPLDDEPLAALFTPNERIRTSLTADVYGTGEADRMLGRAISDKPRDEICVVGAVGHDFYTGERDGAKGFPRFTDPRLRAPAEYADYLRMATERSLERCGIDSFDLLLLHNPDRIGYTSQEVWAGMAALRDAELTRMIGVAPGPANGFTLDLIDCFERYGELLDWAMIILNPLEPWPGELCLAAAADAGVNVITRVVDYGGLFWDDVLPGQEFPPQDHRRFRPQGWIEAGPERMEAMESCPQRGGRTMLQP